jgi:DNA polymerase III epsilon subunit-like protein
MPDKEQEIPPTVFLSYSHDPAEHGDAVLALSNRLREEGIDCCLDQYEESPSEGWPMWSQAPSGSQQAQTSNHQKRYSETPMTDETEWVILDTETDGLTYPIYVVEIAAQRMRGTQKDGEPFQVFLNHGVPIPPDATAIHGYTEGFLAEHGIPPREAYEGLHAYVEDRYVVCHWMRYDWNSALLPERRRLRINQIGRPGFCSWMLSKRSIPELHSHKLDILREHFGLPCSRPHSALGDVESVCGLLTDVVLPRLAQRGLGTFHEVGGFSTTTPILLCHCLLDGRDYAAELRRIQEKRRERKERERLILTVQTGGIPNIPDFLRTRGLITEEPEIEFGGHTFLFTGKMTWGTRPQASKFVSQLGGVVSKSKVVPSSIDFLGLGEDREKGWTALTHGGKLTDAVCRKIADENSRLKLVLENDFLSALLSALESAESKDPRTAL